MKAGRTRPEHKNGGGDSETQDWFAPIIVVRPISLCPGRLPRPLAWQPAPRPQGAPGKPGGGWQTHVKNSLDASFGSQLINVMV